MLVGDGRYESCLCWGRPLEELKEGDLAGSRLLLRSRTGL